MSKKFKSIAVFCGSSSGSDPYYKELAEKTGLYFAKHGITLVYGGGRVGLMGILADACLNAGGEVIGVIPAFLNGKEIRHSTITKTIEVKSMHERKYQMYSLSDAFIALPGGYGTMDELFETITWAQLGLHSKPIGLLNVRNYYQAVINQLDVMVREGFLKATNREIVIENDRIENLLFQMQNYIPHPVPKWLRDNEL